MRLALINGTTVARIAEGGQAFIDAVTPFFTAVIDVTSIECGKGWAWNGSTGSPAFTAPAPTLAEVKQRRAAEIRADGLGRIQAVFPAIESIDVLQLVREQMLSIAPAARQFTADMQRVIDIYTAASNGLAAVQAATTINQVLAVSVNWP